MMLRNRCIIIAALFWFSCTENPTGPEAKVKVAEGIPIQKLTANPFDVQYDSGESFIITQLMGLTTDGAHMLGWSMTDPAFTINTENKVTNIGDYGEGPGEYNRIASGHIAPMGVYLLDSKNQVIFYEDGHYKRDFRLKSRGRSTWPMYSAPGVDEFIVTDDYLITPTLVDKIGQIGSIYTHEGQLIGIVEDPEFDESKLRISTWSQRTHWDILGNRIFVLYLYWGWLLELNDQFEIVKRHQLESPIVNRYLSDYMNADAETVPRKNLPLFYDFQIFRGKGYASTAAALHQIDLDTGEVTRIFRINLAVGEYSNRPHVSLPFFAILDNGTMAVGNMVLDELFLIDLPLEILRQD